MTKLKEFIAMVGRQRFTFLTLMLMFVVGVTVTWQQYLLPQNKSLQSEKNVADSDRLRLVRDIRELPDKYAKLIDNEKRFDGLVEKGFFKDQDRITARIKLDELRTLAGLRGITYDIKPQEKVDHPQSYALNKELVRSNMNVSFKGLTDLEMRDFIQKVTRDFNGLVIVEKVSFERADELDMQHLASLSKQELVDFVSGSADFYWYSIIEKPADPATPQEQAFGEQM
mgnify:CR=1 FL=1